MVEVLKMTQAIASTKAIDLPTTEAMGQLAVRWGNQSIEGNSR